MLESNFSRKRAGKFIKCVSTGKWLATIDDLSNYEISEKKYQYIQ